MAADTIINQDGIVVITAKSPKGEMESFHVLRSTVLLNACGSLLHHIIAGSDASEIVVTMLPAVLSELLALLKQRNLALPGSLVEECTSKWVKNYMLPDVVPFNVSGTYVCVPRVTIHRHSTSLFSSVSASKIAIRDCHGFVYLDLPHPELVLDLVMLMLSQTPRDDADTSVLYACDVTFQTPNYVREGKQAAAWDSLVRYLGLPEYAAGWQIRVQSPRFHKTIVCNNNTTIADILRLCGEYPISGRYTMKESPTLQQLRVHPGDRLSFAFFATILEVRHNKVNRRFCLEASPET